MNDAKLPSGSDCCKTMAPLCLHLSAIRGCVLNQPSGVSITLCIHACVGVSWMDSLRFVGSGDQRTSKVARVNDLFLFSYFLPLPANEGKLNGSSGKVESCWTWITQNAVVFTGGKRASAGSQCSPTAIIHCSSPSACLSLLERPALSLWMSRLQTVTVSGPL